MDLSQIPSPIAEGTIEFTIFDEGGWEFFTCKEPVKVDWSIWPDKSDPTNEIAYIDFDFGMSYRMSVVVKNNFLLNGYNGITPESSYEERVKAIVLFDVMHAFTHYNGDPNYEHLHWALRGWLDMRLEKHERTDEVLAELERVEKLQS